MREIKFRAWDKLKNVMFSPSSINWKNIAGKETLWVCDSHGENKLEYELINPNAELMQFTGLKDKNGKEIYEGDIVNGKASVALHTIIEVKNKQVVYNKKQAMFCVDYNGSLLPLCAIQLEPIQVIGNIYENPEMIKND